MQAAIVTITPDEAEKLLKLNTNNRALVEPHLLFLQQQMESGAWKLNGEAIIVSKGRLIDGQHRLEACVRAGVPFETLLVKGVDEKVFDTIDSGLRRRASDVLHILGEKYATLLAATISFVDDFTTGALATDQRRRRSNADYEVLLDRHPGIRQAVEYYNVLRAQEKQLVPGSMLCGLYYLFSKKDPSLADKFIEQVAVGENLKQSDPAFMLRDRFIQNSISKSKLPKHYLAAITIKAWNALRTGRVPGHLRWSKNEVFPEIV